MTYGSVSEQPRAAKQGHWQDIPHIQQLHPKGANAGYVNGATYCGPAVVAMLARGANRARGMTDARLIQELGEGLVSRNGASPQDLVTMLERANLRPGGSLMTSAYADAQLQAQLRQGNKVIAQVEKVDQKTGERSAHYVLVRGMTPEGKYRISDPLAKGIQEVSPERLQGMVRRAPPDGGVLIPVAPPRHASKAEQPDKLKSAWREVPGKEHTLCGTMARREEHHDFGIDVDHLTSTVARNGFTRPVSPDRMSAHEFADRLLWLKRKGNPEKANALLSILQSSPFPRDQRVFDRVIRAEMRQPGIGKKLLGDPC